MLAKSVQRHKATAMAKRMSPTLERRRVAILYARVSTDGQADSGLGLGGQADVCMKRALDDLYEVIPTPNGKPVHADEGISSRERFRPNLELALDQCRKYAGAGHEVVLVVYSLSRIARNIVELKRIADELEKLGIGLISCMERMDTSTASGKFFFNILGVMYEFERDLISERTIEAMQKAHSDGKTTGPEPYGYLKRMDGSLMLQPDEQAVLQTMLELHGRGWGFTKIANHLNNAGIQAKNRRGPAKWHASTVQKIIWRIEAEGGPAVRVTG